MGKVEKQNKTKQNKTYKTKWPKKHDNSFVKQEFNTCKKKPLVVLFTTVIVAPYFEIVIVKATAPPAPPALPVPSTSTPASYFAAGVTDYLRQRYQIVYKFRRKLLRDQGNFEQQNKILESSIFIINPLKPELNPICYLLALLGAHHFLHVSRIRVKLLTLR